MNRVVVFFRTFVLPSILTLFTAYDLTTEKLPCIVFLIVAFLVIAFCVNSLNKNRDAAITGIVCSVILIAFSSVNLIKIHDQEQQVERWNDFLQGKNLLVEKEGASLKKRADADDKFAQYELGHYYMRKSEYDKAKEYFRKAADNGHALAYSGLSVLYLYGFGGENDYKQAVRTLLLAASRYGYPMKNSVEELSRLGYNLTDEEKEQARQCEKMKAFTDSVFFALRGTSKYKSEDWSILNKHHLELKSLSDRGFLPATELLLSEERLSEKPDSARLHDLAKTLFDGGYVPADPVGDRTLILALAMNLNPNAFAVEYDEQLAELGYFPLLSEDKMSSLYMVFTQMPFDVLLKMYDYLRKQYEYCKEQVKDNPFRESVYLSVSYSPDNNESLLYAQCELMDCIDEIEARLPAI